MSKNCLQCGYENDDKAKFCVRCGTRFSEAFKERLDIDAPAGEKDAAPAEEAGKNGENASGEQLTLEGMTGKDFSAPAAPSDVFGGPPAPAEPDGEKRVGAEWQGSDCRYAYGNGTDRPSGVPAGGIPPYSAAYYEAQRRQWQERAKKEQTVSRRKTLFILSFVGLLLDFLCGIGALMCLPVAILASQDSRALYKAEKKTSSQLVWAMVIGYVGALLGFVFFILVL